MPGAGSFGPSSATTSFTTAAPSATITGSLQGLKNTSLKSVAVLERSDNADEFLKSLQKSIVELDSEFNDIDKQYSGLNSFRAALIEDDLDLFQAVDFTRQKVATIPELISQGVASLISHGTQTVSDLLISSKVVSDIKSIGLPKDISLPSKLGEHAGDNFFACCNHFMQNIGLLTDQLHDKLKLEFIPEGGSAVHSHEMLALSSAHVSLGISVVAPTVIISTLWDTVGSFLRNFQASMLYTSKLNEEEAKVSAAINQCIKSMSESKPSKESCLETLENLNQLIIALADMNASSNKTSDDLVTDTRSILKLSSLATIPFISSLKLITNSTLGCMLASEAIENKIDSVETKIVSKQASSLDQKQQNEKSSLSHSDNIRSLTQRFKNINNALQAVIEQEQRMQHGSSDASSALMAGTASTLTSSALLLLPLLLVELGSITQESAAGIRFSKNSSDHIFAQSDIVSKSDENIGIELNKLFFEAIKTRDALDMAKELGNSSPFVSGLTRASACGSAAGCLNLILGAHSSIVHMQTASHKSTEFPKHTQLNDEEKKRVVDSVDEVKKSNKKMSSGLSTSAPKDLSSEAGLESILRNVILAGRISDTDQGDLKDRNDLNSVGKSSIGVENNLGSASTRFAEFVTGAFSAIAFVSLESGISLEALFKAFGNTLTETIRAFAHIQECSEGPDKIKLTGESGTNLSFLSNGLRLLAESKSKDIPSSQETVFSSAKLLESITSRSLTIFLMQHGILSEALDNLTRPHRDQDEKSQSIVGTKASARKAVISELARVIENRLNDIEGKAIPRLNKDVASQMASFSQQRIVSALSSEMTLLEPFIVLSELSTKASEAERHDQEALTGTTPTKQVSVLSNIIQSFIIECINAGQKSDAENNDESLLGTHEVSRNTSKSTYTLSGYVSLALVETIGTVLGRAFTLLDSKKIAEKSDDISQQSKDELSGNLKLSTAETKADSHLGHTISAIQSFSALRSTLTHLSAALKECADELAAAVQKSSKDDFVQKDLRMHSAQAMLMRSIAAAFTTCASIITRALATGSGVSFSHIISLGKVDELHKLLHSRDASLELHQGKSSQKCSQECGSELSLVTGISTDLAISTVTNLTKILLSASLLGADVLLSVAKIIEILILDVNPEERLKHESQALSVPNLRVSGSSKQSTNLFKSTEMLPSIVTGQLSVSHDDELMRSTLKDLFNSCQQSIDKKIDNMNILEDDSHSDTEVKDDKNIVKLPKYIFQILKSIEPSLSDLDCRSLVNRLNKGGLVLSSYHSEFGGILNFSEEKEDRILRLASDSSSNIKNIYNTRALVEKFIDTMFVKYSKFLKNTSQQEVDPLKKFNEQLGLSLTPETQNLHSYIIEGVANKLAQVNNRISKSLLHGPRVAFNKDGFVRMYKVLRAPTSQSEERTEISEIELNLSSIEESRRRRAENRHKFKASTRQEVESKEKTQTQAQTPSAENETNTLRRSF